MQSALDTFENRKQYYLCAAILAGLYVVSRYNYLFFHSLAEIFSIIVACCIFMFAWNSRKFIDNNYLLYLGICYLFIGSIDLVHTLAYKGMNVFKGYGVNLPTQLWIAARYMESLSLMAAPIALSRKLHFGYVFSAYALVTGLLLIAIFHFNIFPDCFIDGAGLTTFKKNSEYAIALFLIVALMLLIKTRHAFDRNIFKLLAFSICLTIGSELAFTFYVSVYGFSNLVGHYLKAISFFLIYKAIIETGLVKPYSLLFRDLKQREKELRLLNLELEERVRKRTAEIKKEASERRQAEKEALHTKRLLQTVFDGIPDPLLLVDRDMVIKLSNSAAMDYYRIPPASVRARPCFEVFKGRRTPCDDCRIPRAVLQGETGEHERRGRQNPSKRERVSIYPLTDKQGAIQNAIIRIADITESKALERKLIQSEKMISLGILISGIAHEINNPNNYISVNIPILKDYLNVIMPIMDDYASRHPGLEILHMPYDEFRVDIFELLENVQHGSRQIKTIVRDLKTFSRPGRKKAADRCDLKQLIEKVTTFCRGNIKKRVKTFNISLPDDLPQVCLNTQALEQVLVNLLINAAQAFESALAEDSRIDLTVTSKNSTAPCLVIEVADNGRGMDPATLEKVFNPFFSTKAPEKGSGLGLYITQNLIEEMDGRISIESRPHKGTHCRVTFNNCFN